MRKRRVQERLYPQKDAITTDYRQMSIREIAIKYGCSDSTIRDFLLNNSIQMRAFCRPKLLEKNSAEVFRLYQSGMNTKQLAEKFRVDRNTVGYFLRSTGVCRYRQLHKRTFFIENPIDIGMLAGLLLGEGSIVIYKNRAMIRIVNTDTSIIGWLSKFGGRIHWTKPDQKNRKVPCAVWDLAAAVDVFHCLSILLPILVGKKQQLARAALHILKSKYGLEIAE